jgi:chemotaxis protein MotB
MARKKADAHHGGAWKVAYADFVTAMMALFMVLWISAQDEQILIATSQYFQNPFRSVMTSSTGVMQFNSNKSTTSSGRDPGDAKEISRNKQVEMALLTAAAADFYRLLHLDKSLADKPIDVQVTTDGLRVTLFDRSSRPLFVDDTTEFTEWGKFAMQGLSWTIDHHKFHVTIDGHNRAKMVFPKEGYTGWELTADRANACRRILVHYAVDADLIERVTGYADTKPLPGTAPDAPANQRVTLSLTLSSKSRGANRPAAATPATASVPVPVQDKPAL